MFLPLSWSVFLVVLSKLGIRKWNYNLVMIQHYIAGTLIVRSCWGYVVTSFHYAMYPLTKGNLFTERVLSHSAGELEKV
jgi:hypothetical protein